MSEEKELLQKRLMVLDKGVLVKLLLNFCSLDWRTMITMMRSYKEARLEVNKEILRYNGISEQEIDDAVRGIDL